ncbi:MAG: Uncharacterized protein G01um101420_262 [Parcubacteria group bacterium Gr01-1014_20]|nr:MAG: Uncharacterized protein G01um101420_262 [Parcubacteria group bacterium Gr01-1014_20]
MKSLHMITWILLIVGGVNWLLVFFGWELGTAIFGSMDHMVSKVIYLLVGLSALYEIFTHKKNCKMCGSAGM